MFVCFSVAVIGGATVANAKTLSTKTSDMNAEDKLILGVSSSEKEKRALKEDLGDAEKLFVGHIPDIEDVGIFHPIPVPANFEAYDIEPKDAHISLEELVKVTGAKENVEESFYAADKDGDMTISRSEFLEAPWWLEVDKTPTEDDISANGFVTATEDRLPGGEPSWNYILNGNLRDQQNSNNMMSQFGDRQRDMMSQFGHQQNSNAMMSQFGNQQRDKFTMSQNEPKQMTIDIHDDFDNENQVIMTELDLKKLNAKLAKTN